MDFQKIDDILTKSLSLWIISIIIAVGLWIYVIGSQQKDEISRTVLRRVEFINVAPQLEIRNENREIRVYASGLESEINVDENIICEVDTRGLTAGRYRLPVRVIHSRGIRIREFHPSQIDIELIRYADRLVDIEVSLPQDLPSGFYLGDVEIIPRQVSIRGIERDLARIGRVRISPTVEELRSGKELLLPPEFESSEPFDDQVSIEPQQIKLRATLISGNPRRMIPVKARMIGTPHEDYALLSTTVTPAEIVVEGPRAAIDRLAAIETDTVDITGIEGSTSMVVSVRLPADRSTQVIGEGTVRVSVNLQPVSATKEIAGIPVKIEGGGETNWRAMPSTVTVTIEGLPSNINGAAAENLNIEAYVNAENLFSRQATLPVRTRIDSDLFKVTGVSHYTVSISDPE